MRHKKAVPAANRTTSLCDFFDISLPTGTVSPAYSPVKEEKKDLSDKKGTPGSAI